MTTTIKRRGPAGRGREYNVCTGHSQGIVPPWLLMRDHFDMAQIGHKSRRNKRRLRRILWKQLTWKAEVKQERRRKRFLSATAPLGSKLRSFFNRGQR